MATVGEALFFGVKRHDRATLSDVLRHALTEEARRRVDAIREPDFSKKSNDEIVESVRAALAVEPLILLREQGKGDVTERDIHVESFRGGTVAVKGLQVVQRVPFTGDPALWELQPSQYDYSPPHGMVQGNDLIVGISVRENEKEAAIAHIKSTLDKVQIYIDRQTPDVMKFNEELSAAIVPHVVARRSTIESAKDLSGRLDGI
jgi:hypothetical protein